MSQCSYLISGNEPLQCGCCANLGLPLVVTSRWESFKSIVSFNLAQRKLYKNSSGSHVRIYTYTIDDPDQMDWLLGAGVDGIITNKPRLLAQRISLKYHRLAAAGGPNSPRSLH